LPRRGERPVGDGARAAGFQELGAARDARHVVGSGARPLPRPQRRHMGEEGHHAGRALPLPLLARRAGGVGPAAPGGGERGSRSPPDVQQLLCELRHDERPGDRGAPLRPPGRPGLADETTVARRGTRGIDLVDPNTFGIVVIGVSIGAFLVWLATHDRPKLRAWTLASIVVIAIVLVVSVGLLAFSWLGGPD